MAGLHAYHPSSVPSGATVLTLSPAESAHLVRSLRARVGEDIHAFDGTGRSWDGTVAEADARALVMRIDATRALTPPTPALALAQVLPKGGLMDDIVRAAVEIGVAEIHPLFSAHCEVKLDAARAAARVERWNAIAVEACKQSGNPFLPRIAPPVPLEAWLAGLAADTLAFAGSLADGAPPFSGIRLPDTAPARLLFLIGPEGDFSQAEHALIRERGVLGVRFGENVLRVPTAALYALAALDQLRRRPESPPR
ncbi:MAG: 16S rRNA (uracil(1498)-N(3))-methyltransferase [Puniceicoccales bacterium]|jgi:16S rRNA (uracil1498-N3)-methyltransferase|nr:16S rRNA (uracil(1498)-N(3))-methyltransferase [Puniceicoccales bacterium]